MKKLLAILLVCAMVFSFTGAVFAAESTSTDGKVTVSNLVKESNCNSTTKYFENANLGVFKKGNGYVIWTEVAVPEEYQDALIEAIKTSPDTINDDGEYDLENLGTNTEFANGVNVEFVLRQNNNDEKDVKVSITEEGIINFEAHSTWSWFYYGNYTINEKEYVWEKVGNGDSATGMGDRIVTAKKGGTWFMYNTGAETFNIQAGNPKNGTNFVGEYTVESLGDNKYVIVDNASNPEDLDKAPTAEGQELTVISGAKFWVNADGKFETSPGNQKGKAMLVEAGQKFEMDGTLCVFAHFNVDYYVAQEVVAEVLPQ